MLKIRKTDVYEEWFNDLRDVKAKARINVRIRKVSLGNFGDVNPVGQGVSELRFFFGPGYRIYFVKQGKTVVLLLCGGDKKGQSRDIEKAHKMVKELNNGGKNN